MDIHLVTKLNSLNKKFYEAIWKSFDQTRSKSWKGWDEIILSYEPPLSKFSVLDVGCGNARFASFIYSSLIKDNKPPSSGKILSSNFFYHGIDNNDKLLELAEKRLAKLDTNHLVQKLDIITNHEWFKQINQKYNLIVSFGVIHHIPGFENRVKFVQNLEKLIKQDGLLIITAWQFKNKNRFKHKILTDKEIEDKFSIDPTLLEENDHFVTWEKDKIAYRYSHFVDKTEMKKILSHTNLKIVKIYEADGKTENLNKYYWLQKMKN